MSAPELLSQLSKRGVSVEVHGDKLRLLPKGAASDLLSEVARFKPQLIEILAGGAEGAPTAETAIDALARLRNVRRFDFRQGTRVFSPTGRHVRLDAAIISAWKLAEFEVGHRLTVFGVPPKPDPEIPADIHPIDFGHARTHCQLQRAKWRSLTEQEQYEWIVSVARSGVSPS